MFIEYRRLGSYIYSLYCMLAILVQIVGQYDYSTIAIFVHYPAIDMQLQSLTHVSHLTIEIT